MTDAEWYWLTIGMNVLIGLATLPFFAEEMRKKGEMGTAIALHMFMWLVFGPVLLLWVVGLGVLRYYDLWGEFIGVWKHRNDIAGNGP